MSVEFLWCEKYRPKTIEDCILPESLKKTFTEIAEGGELPNMKKATSILYEAR